MNKIYFFQLPHANPCFISSTKSSSDIERRVSQFSASPRSTPAAKLASLSFFRIDDGLISMTLSLGIIRKYAQMNPESSSTAFIYFRTSVSGFSVIHGRKCQCERISHRISGESPISSTIISKSVQRCLVPSFET